ncbi:MAG: hypothetical protein NC829_01200, partial [Candidatus Omnitrophica bacterium]|nr:hypothetical protein [Candidatus Omnitrophota bacterium]
MTFLGLSGLINFITSLLLGIFVLIRNPKNAINRAYFYGNSAITIYSIGYLFWQLAQSYILALFWFKFLTIGIILINIAYLHFVFTFLGIFDKKRKELLIYFFVNIVFIILNLNLKLYSGLEPRYNFGWWPIPTTIFHFYLIFWFWQCFYGFWWLLREYRITMGLRHEQIKYFALAVAVGFLGGATNWLMWYKIRFPPYANILISLYVFIIAYAILRHRLMDINIAITRAGIFAVVYTLVLGLPFVAIKFLKPVLMPLWGVYW